MKHRLHPRWLAHLRALLTGYFWLPCALCGQNFAGFEDNGAGIQDPNYPIDEENGQSTFYGITVCPDCSDHPAVAEFHEKQDLAAARWYEHHSTPDATNGMTLDELLGHADNRHADIERLLQ